MYSGLIKYIFLPGIEPNKVQKKKEGGRSRWQDREAKIEATKLRIFIFLFVSVSEIVAYIKMNRF